MHSLHKASDIYSLCLMSQVCGSFVRSACDFVMRIGIIEHNPLSHSPCRYHVSGFIYQHKGAFVLSGCPVFFCVRLFVYDAAGLLLQRWAARHVPGLCGQWFGSRPASQMAGASISLSFSVYLVQFCPRASPRSPCPPPTPPLTVQMKTFSLECRGERRISHSELQECIKRVKMCH